jgi:hypothetical protein
MPSLLPACEPARIEKSYEFVKQMFLVRVDANELVEDPLRLGIGVQGLE